MAQRLMKKLEGPAGALTLILLIFIVGKYLDTRAAKEKIFTVRDEVEELLPKAESSMGKKQYSLNLFFENNTWILKGEGSENFRLEKDETEKLVIVPKYPENPHGNGLRYSANIDGVDTYYSIGEKIPTDILVSGSEQKVKLYEQEDFLPILGYHNILSDNEEIKSPTLEMHVSKFDQQVNYMTNVMGCRWFTFSNIMENYVLKGEKIPKKACVLNFDDGRKNHFIHGYQTFKKYGAVATFYIIAKRTLDKQPSYMSTRELNELYENGNEIGAHTVDSGGLITARFNHKGLVYQIERGKELLEKEGYRITTFAYPWGEQNEQIVDIVRQNYKAGRDTAKDNPWREKRTETVSLDPNFIWHMHYYKPEQKEPEELQKEIGYNTWWQFEEGFRIDNTVQSNVKVVSSYQPTETSYAVVSLPKTGDKASSKFLVSNHDIYTIEVFGTVNTMDNQGWYSPVAPLNIYVDGVKQEQKRLLDPKVCTLHSKQYYCFYTVTLPLGKGEHEISVESKSTFAKVDKYRMYREIPKKNIYGVEVTEESF